MLVSQVSDSNGFAIVGGGAVRAGSVRDDAGAFRIMSDALYNNKHLAVAREVICNAVDAHIMVGKPDLPVRVTISNNEFIVQDFGPGIPDDRIADIYLSLFGSTKRDDTRQTGGFGLGSKSPFAITDHFIVTNCHGNTRYVYAVHRGDQMTDGKPALVLMSKAPCDTSGLTVQVPLANDRDAKLLKEAISEVVWNGGIKAIVNGEEAPRNDYTGIEEQGFVATKGRMRSAINVICGNVVYPVREHADLNPLIKRLSRLCSAESSFLLYAEPGSIEPTPSREDLSYTELTLATLKRLLKRACVAIEAELHKAADRLVEIALDHEDRPNAYKIPLYCVGLTMNGRMTAVEDLSFNKPSDIAVRLLRSTARNEGGAYGTYFMDSCRTMIERALYRYANKRRDVVWFCDPKKSRRYSGDYAGRLTERHIARVCARTGVRPSRVMMVTRDEGSLIEYNSSFVTDEFYVAHDRLAALQCKARGVYFVLNKATAHLAPKIVAELTRLKHTVEELEAAYTPPPRKPKPSGEIFGPFLPKESFESAHGMELREYRGAMAVAQQNMLGTPIAFIAGERLSYGGSVGTRTRFPMGYYASFPLLNVKRAIALFGEKRIALGSKRVDVKRLEELKVPLFEEWLLDLAKRRLKKPSAIDLHYLATAKMMTDMNIYELKSRLFNAGRPFVDVLTNFKPRDRKKADEAYLFWILVMASFHRVYGRDTFPNDSTFNRYKAAFTSMNDLIDKQDLPKVKIRKLLEADRYFDLSTFIVHDSSEDLAAVLEFYLNRMAARSTSK